MVKFNFNKIGKFKGKGIINLDKIKVDCDLPSQFEMYDPVSMRVILLDEVDAFTMCVEPTDNEKKIIQGMFIIGLCKVFENEEIYKENMIILDQNTKRKGKGLGLSFNSANNR